MKKTQNETSNKQLNLLYFLNYITLFSFIEALKGYFINDKEAKMK